MPRLVEETCEDRKYRCCETLAPTEHFRTYGYVPSQCDETCTAKQHRPEESK